MIYDDYGTDVEAIEDQRRDADMQMAEMQRVGNAIDAARKAGHCTHQSVVGYAGQVYYPEQEGLQPGQVACTEHVNGCKAVFESDDAWFEAMKNAIGA